MSSTSLYRHFDGDGELLYIGISGNPERRLGEHKRSADWCDEIASPATEAYATRAEAINAESAAIETERPMHNKRPGDLVHDGKSDQTKESTITIRVTPAVKALAVKRAEAERRSLASCIAVLIERDAEAAELSLLPGNFPGSKAKRK
jgi:predicted GIY-YIG superfamily endonuclease